jgi:FlgD Ig-like domain
MSVRLRKWSAAALLLAGLVTAGPAHALKVATWNLLDYDDSTTPSIITPRQQYFRTAMAAMDPDVIMVQELLSVAAADSFLNDVLNVVAPGQYTRAPYIVSTPTTQSCVFYKPAKVNVTNSVTINDGGPRNVLVCIVKPVGYLTNPGWFRLYSIHLKASSVPSDSTTRRVECNNLRNAINNLTSQGPNFIVGGDTNFYTALEPGYIGLTQSISGTNGNNGRCYDPLGAQMANMDWHVNPDFALYDTQCPCLGCPNIPPLTYASGGMDDRFDIIFTSYSLADGQGVDYVNYYAFGQDGQHFNADINGPPTNSAVGQAVADALWGASDHLPVVAVVQLASRVSAPSAVSFGSVIVGGAAQQTLNVTDGGAPPVDALDYSFATVPAGFTAPAGPFTVANGSVNPHALGMDTSSPGARTGTLVMSTDDPDSASKPVQLSGTVLDHAQPSLDSLVATTAGAVDWGTRAGGSFGDTTVTVFDRGYGPLRSRLSIGGATITGGSGRFSLVGASFPTLVAGAGQPFAVHFDDNGAAPDTTYQATLTFSTADEPLPGATPLTPLTVSLSAHRMDATGVGDTPVRTLAFLAPRPNPLTDGCTIGFDLPRPADAELAIFDLGGRRVATLASGAEDAGRHLLHWDATDASGTRVGAGVYFVRFHTAGLERTARLVVLR